jgi:hypothetical protein
MPLDSAEITRSALAGDGDILVAAAAGAVLIAGLGNRAGNFVGIDGAMGGGLCKFP